FFSPEHLKVRSYECAIETLDMQDIDNPIFIKIDVEGHEHQVINGAIKTLSEFEPVLLIESLLDKPGLLDHLKSLRYEPYYFEYTKFIAGFPTTGAGRNTFLFTRRQMDKIS